MDVKGAVVVITGAAHGIGLEPARQLASLGATAVVTARQPSEAAAAAIRFRSEGQVVGLGVGLDVTDDDSVTVAAASIAEQFGRVDILVNNAAAYVDWTEKASSADLAQAARVLDVNLFGTWRVTKAFLPLLRESLHPRVVNVSSGAGSHGDTAFGLTVRGGAAASYGISKAALNALTSTLAAELAGTGILVNSVCPGLTVTFDGAESMGARPVHEGAGSVVWAALLDDDGPNGGLFRDGDPLAW